MYLSTYFDGLGFSSKQNSKSEIQWHAQQWKPNDARSPTRGHFITTAIAVAVVVVVVVVLLVVCI